MGMFKKIVECHISTISHGDIVLCQDGNERSIDKKNIKKDTFMGITIFGDSYKLGIIPVKKIVYEKSISS